MAPFSLPSYGGSAEPRAGHEAFASGATEVAATLSSLTDALTPAEAARLTTLLERMLEHRGLR